MVRLLLAAAIVIGLVGHFGLASVPITTAQCSYAAGTPVQLVGTPHLFIADAQGVLHWGGDTRALAGHDIAWGNQCTVTLSELTAATRGDPWLTAGLPKIGDPIYLAKWEDTDATPRLLHIQSIADVELFGINTPNYGAFVLDRGPWEARFGFNAGTLRVGPLASAASFAWSEADRAAYTKLLSDMEAAETTALFAATSTGTGPEAALPRIATCEKQGLDLFDSTRDANQALNRMQSCLGGSSVSTPIPVSAVPVTPPNLRVTMQGAAGFLITWDAVPGVTGYRVYGGAQGTTPIDTLVTTTPANLTVTTVTGLTTGMTYCYSVSALNATGESPRSAPICATVAGSTAAPSTPSGLQVQTTTVDSVTLTWTNTATDQDGFYLYEADNTVANIPSTMTSWTITGWNSAVQHCYAISAYNELGQSARSNSVCAGPLGAPTATPAPVPPTPTATAVPTVPTPR